MSIRSPFLFSPEVYDKEPHEVDYDAELRKNPEFWKNRLFEYEVAMLKRVCSINRISAKEFERKKKILREKVDLYFDKYESNKMKNIVGKWKETARRWIENRKLKS